MSVGAKYRKVPVEIMAWLIPSDPDAAEDVVLEINSPDMYVCLDPATDEEGSYGGIEIRTLEGTMRGDPGDYIIRGVQGEFYPCKPDIFKATYEPATPALHDYPSEVTA